MDARQRRAFRGMFLKLEVTLNQLDLHKLAFYYDKDYDKDETINGVEFFKDLIRECAICFTAESLNELNGTLKMIKREDLSSLVERYMTQWDFKIVPAAQTFLPTHLSQSKPLEGKEQEGTVSSSEEGSNSVEDCLKGMESVMISGFRKSGCGIEGYRSYTASPRGKKRKIGKLS